MSPRGTHFRALSPLCRALPPTRPLWRGWLTCKLFGATLCVQRWFWRRVGAELLLLKGVRESGCGPMEQDSLRGRRAAKVSGSGLGAKGGW